MFDAHCICPNMIVNYIKDSHFYDYLTRSNSQIILDDNGCIHSEYIRAIKLSGDISKYEDLKIILKYLERMDGRILKVNSNTEVTDAKQLMLDITSKAITTFNKSFLVCNNNDYSDYLMELQNQRINLFNYSNLNVLLQGTPVHLSGPLLNYNQLMEDLEFTLYKLIRANKAGKTEDEINDYIRDILEAKKYTLRDQTREGVSSSGISIGELDLVVLDGQKLFTIIEAMKLSSVQQDYINVHYRKLLINYNPLGVKRTFLISYFTGKDFSGFNKNYEHYIKNLNSDIFECDEISLGEFKQEEISYTNIRKYIHNIIVNDSPTYCIHYTIKI